MTTQYRELKPIRETFDDYDAIEKRIKLVFRIKVYNPILKQLALNRKTLSNALNDALLEAISSGRVTYVDGTFRGKFTGAITKDIRRLGGKWDWRQAAFVVPQTSLPMDVRQGITEAELKFQSRILGIDRTLAAISPAEIADSTDLSGFFSSTIDKTERRLSETLQGIATQPVLSPERKQRIADEWQTNMELWIKNFAEKEIIALRTAVMASSVAGNRYESMVKSIQQSYGVTANKAKFLARQETSLLAAKFKETRYQDAGVNEYRWRCVVGSVKHPVRPAHKALNGLVFRFDDPPITTSPGEATRRNNPGQDYNCRCVAIPLVRFK